MARKKRKADVLDLKALVGDQEEFLRALVQETVQAVLEAEIEECLQAAKSERTASRLGYSLGVLPADSDDPSWEAGVAGAAGPAGSVLDRGSRTLPAPREGIGFGAGGHRLGIAPDYGVGRGLTPKALGRPEIEHAS